MDLLPPQNIEIESACLSSAILSKSALLKLISTAYSEDFYLDKHRIIFEALLALSKQSEVDLIVLKDYLQKTQQLDSIGGDAYFVELFNSARTSNIDEYIKQLKHYSKLRQIIHKSSVAIEEAYSNENPQDIITKISDGFKDINRDQSKDILKLSDIMGNCIKDIQLETGDCISTGIKPLDQEVLILPEDLIILAARPSMGKTSLALNIAQNISVNDPVLFFSLEQSAVDLSIRMLCAETNIAFKKIKLANMLDQFEIEALNKAYNKVKNLNLYIDDSPATSGEIVNNTKRFIDIVKPKIIITDYLQLIKPVDKKIQRHLQIQEITRSFKNCAKETGIPHVLLSQLNRAVEQRQNKRPMLSDLRESGDIEQDADKVIFIYAEDASDFQRELIIAKYRNGATGAIDLEFNGRSMQFL